MAVSKMTQIDKAMTRARDRTRAEIAQKLADGLPVATLDNGTMEVQQLVENPGPYLKTSTIAPKLVKLKRLPKLRLSLGAMTEEEFESERRASGGRRI